jgi:hypothetical protein
MSSTFEEKRYFDGERFFLRLNLFIFLAQKTIALQQWPWFGPAPVAFNGS